MTVLLENLERYRLTHITELASIMYGEILDVTIENFIKKNDILIFRTKH